MSTRSPDVPVAVGEASKRHKGKWILMEVTDYDKHHEPAAGYVRLASKNRLEINDEAVRIHRTPLPTAGRNLYIFHASLYLDSPDDLWLMDPASGLSADLIGTWGKRARLGR